MFLCLSHKYLILYNNSSFSWPWQLFSWPSKKRISLFFYLNGVGHLVHPLRSNLLSVRIHVHTEVHGHEGTWTRRCVYNLLSFILWSLGVLRGGKGLEINGKGKLNVIHLEWSTCVQWRILIPLCTELKYLHLKVVFLFLIEYRKGLRY